MNTLSKTLLILGIVGLIVGLILYFQGTVMVDVSDVPVKIDKAARYTEQGFFSRNYYSQIQVAPTSATEPNMAYLLVLDNGIIKQNYKVSWSQLELDIRKLKTATNKITEDEYTALGMKPSYTTQMFEVRPQRQMPYLLPGIVLLGAFISSYVLSKLRGVPSSPPPKKGTGAIPTFEGTASPHLASSPEGKTWWVPPDGPASDTPPPNTSGQASCPESEPRGEPIDSQSPYSDFLTNQIINRLCKERKITIEEAESVRRQIKSMDFFERYRFLSDIEHRDENREV